MKLKTYLSECFSSVEHFIVGRAKLFLSKKAIFIFMKAAAVAVLYSGLKLRKEIESRKEILIGNER
jgi:hypothetical protein